MVTRLPVVVPLTMMLPSVLTVPSAGLVSVIVSDGGGAAVADGRRRGRLFRQWPVMVISSSARFALRDRIGGDDREVVAAARERHLLRDHSPSRWQLVLYSSSPGPRIVIAAPGPAVPWTVISASIVLKTLAGLGQSTGVTSTKRSNWTPR